MEHRIRRNQFKQVIRLPFLLDPAAGLHGQLPDPLVRFLAVAAGLDSIHHNVFRRHEWQLFPQMLLNDLRVYLQSVRDVQAQIQNSVDGKETLRNGYPLVRGVIERTLKPLDRACKRRVQSIADDIAREGADALGAHRVSLVRHGA